MQETNTKNRPEFRNIHMMKDLPQYRWPMASLASGTHRISGFFQFFMLPVMLYLLDLSLTSESTFGYMKGLASSWPVKLLILAISWAYLHHLLCGIRALLMDLHIAVSKDGARKSSAIVFCISLPLAALIALKLIGVF